VSFELASASDVRIEVLDVSGRRVRTLVAQWQPPGRYTTEWDGLDDRGQRMPPGVYHYRMRAGSFSAARRVVLVH